MPLSEHEQRILSEIEEQLLASDPGLARSVGSRRVGGDRQRLLRLGALGIVVGLVATVALLPVSFIWSFAVGVGIMFVGGLAVERGLRADRRQSRPPKAQRRLQFGLKDYFSDASQRARGAERPEE